MRQYLETNPKPQPMSIHGLAENGLSKEREFPSPAPGVDLRNTESENVASRK